MRVAELRVKTNTRGLTRQMNRKMIGGFAVESPESARAWPLSQVEPDSALWGLEGEGWSYAGDCGSFRELGLQESDETCAESWAIAIPTSKYQFGQVWGANAEGYRPTC